MSSGFIVVTWSPKGGVGKTMLAVATALQCAQVRKTVLVDGNPDNADLVSLLQCPNVPNISTWPGEVEQNAVEQHLVRRSSRLFLLPGPTRYVDEGVFTKDVMEHVLRTLRGAGMAVVVDLSSSLRDSTLMALDLADRILVPATLDLLSLTPLIRLAKEQDFLQLPLHKFRLVINRYTDTKEITAEDVREHSFCPVSGTIPSSRAVAAAINRGECESALGPASPIGKALSGFLPELLPTGLESLDSGSTSSVQAVAPAGLFGKLRALTGREGG
jgi:Flp pilus assembly CpaE family ATPase